jgi:uncharacterized membrane protein
MPLFANRYRDHEPVWHVQLVMVFAIVLQLLLPAHYVFGSRYILIAIEFLLLVALSFTTPKDPLFHSLSRRLNVYLLIGLTAIANGYALLLVADKLLNSSQVQNGHELIITALNIYLTNLIVFGLLYWEMDGGGPGQRRATAKHEQDFLFPQNQNESYKHPKWQPTFLDYLYVSGTNAMAFSPTDTMPLSRRAKVMMLVQATLSLITIALVAARAVNILN